MDFGAGMGPFILGLLIPFMGYRYLYLAMAGLIIIAMILYFFVHGRYQNSTSSKVIKSVRSFNMNTRSFVIFTRFLRHPSH